MSLQRTALRAAGVTLAIAGVLGLSHLLGVGLPLLFGAAAVLGLIAWSIPHFGVRILDTAVQFVRGWFWASEQGRFHAFNGIPLQIEDDGRHVWLGGTSLQRVLGSREPEDVQAARHAGFWRRNAKGTLWLRVDVVVQNLATMPGREAPRLQKFRRYLEREVLYPASQRRKQH